MTKTKPRADQPYPITSTHALMAMNCNGNGERTAERPTKRRHSGRCQARKRRIGAGELITFARWDQPPYITAHCPDCAEAYLPKPNEADTTKTPQPQAAQPDAAKEPEKNSRRETPRNAPRGTPGSKRNAKPKPARAQSGTGQRGRRR